ncbi:MAG: hypothetical protein GY820_11350 [Gammaproteobacteria bacterium]|nr:hypothetical protein [Gammaproteobacteria bacterium]
MAHWANQTDVHNFTNDFVYCVSKLVCPHIFTSAATPHIGILKVQKLIDHCNAFEQYYYNKFGNILLNDISGTFFSSYYTFKEMAEGIFFNGINPQRFATFLIMVKIAAEKKIQEGNIIQVVDIATWAATFILAEISPWLQQHDNYLFYGEYCHDPQYNNNLLLHCTLY